MLKEKNCQPRILYPVKISFGNEGETKTLSDDRELRDSVASRPSPKRTINESSLNGKEMIIEGTLEYQEGRKKIMV